MTEIYALDVGFPGAGRVLRELSKVFPKSVAYTNLSREREKGWVDADFLMLPAWNPDYAWMLDNATAGGFKTVIVWTSPPLQSEMVPQELEYMKTILSLLDGGRIHALWLGDKNWLPLVKKEERRVFYAPYPVSLPQQAVSRELHPVMNVSLFGPLHPRKNVLTQLIAAKVAEVTLHTTDPDVRLGTGAFSVMKEGVVVSHGWLPEDQYEELLLNHIDLGLQVSVPSVESFSYVAWDHISRGIPCLSTASWVPEELQVNEPFNPSALSVQMLSSRVTKEDPAFWRNRAQSHAFRANGDCREALERELGISLA